MRDVVIIGGGVTGCAIARELSRYEADICVIEKEEDVCCGTSKANSGIVHAGFDAPIGSLMAEMNVKGNALMEELSKELDFPFKRIGSMVLCFSKEQLPKLQELYDQGMQNGVPGLELLSKEQALAMEPALSKEVCGALLAKTGGIVDPFGLTIALAENAATNGVEFKFDTEVQSIERNGEAFDVVTDKGAIKTKCVVNAAGVYADVFHNMVSEDKIQIIPRRGNYFLLDKDCGEFVSHTIFQLPEAKGKGVLITPTTHGNLLVGPTAVDTDDKEATKTTFDEMTQVTEKSKKSAPDIPLEKVITSFAGLRAHQAGHEFIIEEVKGASGFFDCAGIESPGLTSAPAIGIKVSKMVSDRLGLEEKTAFRPNREGIKSPLALEESQLIKLIDENPDYGNIVCRCERVTEGEIIEAIHRQPGAKSLDGVKRRTRAGMGRCQAGFCSSRVIEIIARELGIDEKDVTKSGGNSYLIQGIDKENIGETQR